MSRVTKRWLTAACSAVVVVVHMGLPLVKPQATLPAAQTPPKSSTEQKQKLTKQIERLVRQLDDDAFQVREDAERKLVEIGLSALDAVSQASKSPSAEVRARARRILAKLKELKKNLRYVDFAAHADLKNAVSAAVSADGKFLYAAAWQANAVCVFSRDAKTGQLKHIQTVSDREGLRGAISVRLSPDGRYALATAFQSQTAVLFLREAESGRLTISDVARNDQNGVDGLRWALDGVFSPDSRFVYVIDPRGSGSRVPTVDGQPGAVTAFRITKDGKLRWIEANRGREECFNGARGIAMHPRGKMLFVTSSGQGALMVLSRDTDSGRTRVRQIIRDGQMGVRGLEGVSSVACSPDGHFVYTSSGRFRGDHAVGIYRLDADGKLSAVQELFNGKDGLQDFLGGNEIAVSPDGRNVYAAATGSETIVAFQRDLKTGRLTSPEVTHFSSLRPLGTGLGPAGLGISPDGKNVYVALESSGAIAVFQRQTARAATAE